MNIRAIRLLKLKKLISACDSAAEFAEKIGTDPSYISQIVTGVKTPKGKARGVGDDLAAKIEKAYKKPAGWMDNLEAEDMDVRLAETPAEYGQIVRYVEKKTGDILIPKLSVSASMGNGIALQDYVDVVTTLRINAVELRRHLRFSAPENLRLLTGYGDSMKGTYNDGDVLIVDVGVTEINVDGVYVLEKNDELFIKRMQRTGDHYMMISDNRFYIPVQLSKADLSTFKIHAKVIRVWNAVNL